MQTLDNPITAVPFDLYRDIHKAIRVTLFDVTADAGRLDPSDRLGRIAHAERVVDLARFLKAHAEHEDQHIAAAVAEVLPDRGVELGSSHVAFEDRMDEIVAIADLAREPGRGDERAAVHHLYLELASFVSDYLAHQDIEERVVMPALWNAFGIGPMLEIHGAILASISPSDMAWSLAKMLPAMNADDRTEMFAAMQAEAPPEAFAGVCELASHVLTAPDYRSLVIRVGLEPVGIC